MSFEFKLSDANAKILNTAGKYLTDNINIMLDGAVASKIVSGNTILGVAGTATELKAQDKKGVTISAKSATIKPDSGYNSMSSLAYTVADAAYAINGGGLTGGDAVTPTVTLSLGNSDLTTSGNEATNIYSGTSGATLYDSEAAAKTAGYNYFLEINGSSSAGSSTVSRDAMHVRASKAGWINSGDSATVNTASKTVTVNSGSKKKFVGVKTGSVTIGGGTVSATGGTASATAGSASVDVASAIATDASATMFSISASATGGNASANGGSASVTAVTKTQAAGYIPAQSATQVIAGSSKNGEKKTATGANASATKYIRVGKLNNAPTSGVTYNEINASTATIGNTSADVSSNGVLTKSKFISGAGSVVIPAEGALYINAGYYDNLKLTLSTIIPDDTNYTNAGTAQILKGYEAYTPDGKKLIGTMTNGISRTHDGGALSAAATATVSVSKPSVSGKLSGSSIKDLSSSVTTTTYGITATKPSSGTDGTNYLTFTPSGSQTAAGKATGTASASASITKLTCTEAAGYTAGGTHTCKEADSKTASDSKETPINASISDGKSYYMPIVGVSFTAGAVSGSTDVGAGNATLSTSNTSGVSVTSSGSANVAAAKYSNSAGAIASHSSATASGTAASGNLPSATKYITGVTIGAGKSFSLTNNTTTSTTNINGGKTTAGGLTMVGKVATIYTGTNQSVSVTDANGTLKTGSVKLNAVTISQGTTTAAISAGTASNEISSKCAVSTSAPSDGYFAKLALTSPKVTGTATGTTTAGWISSNPASASVTVNAGSGTAYVKIPAGSTTVSASVPSAPAVTVSGSTNMATTSSGTYYFTVSANKTDGKVKGTATITEGYQPAGNKESSEVAVTPTISGSGTKVYIRPASDTLYSNTSNSTSGFKTTKTYENTQGYMPAGAKTAYTSTIDTVSGTGTITAVPSGATVNITSNAGTTNINANTGTVNFVNWKLCNNAADACLDIYF